MHNAAYKGIDLISFSNQKFLVDNHFWQVYFYKLVANIPIINPNILPIAVILPLYNLFDSGTSSP